MRPVRKILLQRLAKQAEEADLLGLTKLAARLTDQIEDLPVREDEKFFYSASDFSLALEDYFWKAAMETLNFHNVTNFDIRQIDEICSQSKEEFLFALRQKLGLASPIGGYEEQLPGESCEHVDLEIEE